MKSRIIKTLIGTAFLINFSVCSFAEDDGHQHEGSHAEHHEGSHAKHDEGSHKAESETKAMIIKGEILDLVCYASKGHNPDCAAACISSGAPAGIKGEDGTIYIISPDNKTTDTLKIAANARLSVSVKGEVASHDGINVIKNAQIVSQETVEEGSGEDSGNQATHEGSHSF